MLHAGTPTPLALTVLADFPVRVMAEVKHGKTVFTQTKAFQGGETEISRVDLHNNVFEESLTIILFLRFDQSPYTPSCEYDFPVLSYFLLNVLTMCMCLKMLVQSLQILEYTPNSLLNLTVRGYREDNLIFANTTTLTFSPRNVSTVIQTDRSCYQPGDTVKVRVVSVQLNNRPYKGRVEISIQVGLCVFCVKEQSQRS